jgi:hypothetical protein
MAFILAQFTLHFLKLRFGGSLDKNFIIGTYPFAALSSHNYLLQFELKLLKSNQSQLRQLRRMIVLQKIYLLLLYDLRLLVKFT